MKKKILTGILIFIITELLSMGWGIWCESLFVGQNVQTFAGLIGGGILGVIGLLVWALVNDV